VVLAFVFLVAVAVRSHGGEVNLATCGWRKGGTDIGGQKLLISLAEIGLGDNPVEATHTSSVDELVDQLHELPVVDLAIRTANHASGDATVLVRRVRRRVL